MADTKISALPASATPLAGSEVLPIVQIGNTVQVSVANLTAGRAVATGALTVTGALSATTTGQVGTTLGVGGATPSASGSGITFPATQSTSSNANTLDDYEEGTWTPTVGGTATYNIQEGRYTKIGRQVTIQGIIEISTIGTGSATTISGLPFTVDGVTTMAVGYFANLASSVVFISGRVDNGTTNIVFSTLAAAATGSTLGGSIMGSATRIDFSGLYFV